MNEKQIITEARGIYISEEEALRAIEGIRIIKYIEKENSKPFIY